MSKRFANKYQYDDLLIRSRDPYANAKYEVLISWLEGKKIKNVLNAGCGSGELSFILAKKGYDVTGFDPDGDYIKLARKNIRNWRIKNCKFEVSGIESYKCRVKYDAVVATDVLEHIKDDKYAFSKMTDFVRPGGLILITVPAGQYLFGYHDQKLGHYRRYSIDSFRAIIPKSLSTKKIRYFGFFLVPVAFLVSKIVKKNYPVASSGDSKKNPVMSKILSLVLSFEKKYGLCLGTSILFMGRKN